ncbi:hypothetical protein [Vibrio owensii]|uniref:hypothetical protein n=1 Tax=Vibrio owensii TaxID=696485 RepID=UPI0018F12E64|nr:hypothetical protein [Vibrio owensii]
MNLIVDRLVVGFFVTTLIVHASGFALSAHYEGQRSDLVLELEQLQREVVIRQVEVSTLGFSNE